MANQTASPGLRAFFIIWIGQLVSLVGSQLTAFALGDIQIIEPCLRRSRRRTLPS